MIDKVIDKNTKEEYVYITAESDNEIQRPLNLKNAIKEVLRNDAYDRATVVGLSDLDAYYLHNDAVRPFIFKTIVFDKELFGNPETYWRDEQERLDVENKLTEIAMDARKHGLASRISDNFYAESLIYSNATLSKMLKLIDM
jgi:hypothetical protein